MYAMAPIKSKKMYKPTYTYYICTYNKRMQEKNQIMFTTEDSLHVPLYLTRNDRTIIPY